MKTRIICPYCRVTLMIQENVLFRVRTKNQGIGIVIINPEKGNYKYINPPELEFEQGERIEFLCPICCERLSTINSSEDLVDVILIDELKHESHVYFSSHAGAHIIFKTEEKV